MFLELFQHTSQCRIGAFAKRVHATFPAHICLQPCIVGRYVEATTWTDFMAAFLFYAAKSCTWTRIQKPQITNHGEDDTEAASSIKQVSRTTVKLPIKQNFNCEQLACKLNSQKDKRVICAPSAPQIYRSEFKSCSNSFIFSLQNSH